MTSTHGTSGNKIFIPGLVREAYYEASIHKVPITPTLIKSAITQVDGGQRTSTGDGDATTVHFEWTTTGSRGELYKIRAIGALKWERYSRNQFVAQGLKVECTCPHGEQQAGVSETLGKIVVCKHASAALATVLDPSASCPENVSTTYMPTILDIGVSVSEHIFKSTRGNACESCGFQDWNIGDIKYIIEHWEDPKSDHGAREHLCFTCAVDRGLFAEYKSTNDDNEDTKDDGKGKKCQGCGNFSFDQIGSCTVEGFLKVKDFRSNEILQLCFKCAHDRLHSSLQPSAGNKRKTREPPAESDFN